MGAIEKKGSERKPIYRINEEFFKEGFKIQNKESLDAYDASNIMPFEIEKYPDSKYYRCVLYGISEKLFNSFDFEEKTETQEHI